MKLRVLRFLPALLALPALADIQFTAKITDNPKLGRGKGECEIRLSVDEAVEVRIQGNRVEAHNVSGAEARDEGSTCTAPLPDRDFEGFKFEVKQKQKRGEVQLSQPPSRSNGYRAVVFIRDKEAGSGDYEFRVSWTAPPPEPPAGMSLNNTIHAQGRGHGEAKLDDEAAIAFAGVTVDLDNGGKIFVVMTPERGKPGAPASFSGSLMSWEGGVMKADVAADERLARLRGPMYLYFDGKRQVYKIELQATDGQRKLSVKWEAR